MSMAEYYDSRTEDCEGFGGNRDFHKREFSLSHDRCPFKSCGGYLILMKSNTGRMFFGCSNYPECRGSLRIETKADVRLWYEKNIKYGRWPHSVGGIDIKKYVNDKQTRRHQR